MTVGDRADSYGAGGGNLSLEIRAALQIDPDNRTRVLSRIYGLGGKDFYAADAADFFAQAQKAARSDGAVEPFAYHGATAGRADRGPRPGLPPIRAEETRGMAHVARYPSTGRLRVELEPIWKMTEYRAASRPDMAPVPAADSSRPSIRSAECSKAISSSCTRRVARWWSPPAIRPRRTASITSTTCFRTVRPRSRDSSRCITSASAGGAPCLRRHHVRDDHR